MSLKDKIGRFAAESASWPYLDTVTPTNAADARRAKCDASEAIDLGASEIACAVADAWAAMTDVEKGRVAAVPQGQFLYPTLDRLEAATRGSALRKVRP